MRPPARILGTADRLRYKSRQGEPPVMEEERKQRADEARRRFEKATADMAAERRFGGPDAARSEIEVLEEATSLCRNVMPPK